MPISRFDSNLASWKKILALNLLLARLNKGTMALSRTKNSVLLAKAVKGQIDSSELEREWDDFANSVVNPATTLKADGEVQDNDPIPTSNIA